MPAPRNIFIIDDDSDFVSLLSEIFTQAGYAVHSSTKPTEALAALQGATVDLVVIDQRMPELTGVELLTQLRKTHPTVPVVVVSGFLENAIAQQFINLGVAGLFFKPLNLFALLKRVEEIFKGSVKSSGTPTAAPEMGLRGFTRTPFGSGVTKEVFLKKLQSLASFKGNLLLIGEPNSPFEAVAAELVKKSNNDKLIMWDRAFCETPQALPDALGGATVATVLVPQIDNLTASERTLLYKLSKHDTSAALIPALRFIFCLSEDLDSLYEKKVVDDQFYLFLGNLELKLPKVATPQNLHKTDALARAAQGMGNLAPVAAATAAPFKGSGRVLVLDDEELHADMVCDLLTEAGLKSLKMTHPSEALLALRKERFSLLITDFRMPGVNGVEFVSQTRQIDPSLPVLVVTGNIQVPEMVRVGNMGITKLIQKPINPKSFIEEVMAVARV